MKPFLPAVLAILLPLAAAADPSAWQEGKIWAHDLTDPRVKGFSTSAEFQIHHDKAILDLWLQYTDLAALLFRQGWDADEDKTLSDAELKEAEARTGAGVFEDSVLVEIAESGKKLERADLHWEKRALDDGGDRKVLDGRIKINCQFSLKDFVPKPGVRYEVVLTIVDSDVKATRLNGRVIHEGNIAVGLQDGARETFDSFAAGRDCKTGTGFTIAFWFEVPEKFEGGGDFTTTWGKRVDMKTGQLFDPPPPPPKSWLDKLGAVYNDRIRVFLNGDRKPPFGLVVLTLALAFAYGAAHAIGPGHGKTLVAAYLVGSHGRISHAILLGLTVTISHVGVVIAIGLAMLFWKVNEEGAGRWISLGSGFTIIGMGVWLLYSRWRFGLGHSHGPGGHTHLPGGGIAYTNSHGEAHDHSHDHGHDHENAHFHEHSHGPDGDIETLQPMEAPKVTAWDLITTGILGGMVPCPAGLFILLFSLYAQRVGWGLILLCAFSLGLGGVLTIIGILLLTAKRFMSARMEGSGPWLRRAAIASSAVIVCLGVFLTVQAVLAFRN